MAENILDARLIEQFEQRLSGAEAAASSNSSTGEKSGMKRKASKENKKGEDKKKKKDEKPSFLLPTASGRTPKVTNRYEGKFDDNKKENKEQGNTSNGGNANAGNAHNGSNVNSNASAVNIIKKKEECADEKAENVQREFRMLPTVKSFLSNRRTVITDDDDEFEVTEWVPPDTWTCLEKVFVTDVTVDDVTVTMRESKTPDGFFTHPV